MKSVKILPLKKPVEAEVTIPGSKSYTNRALLLGALTKNSISITNPLISDDTKAMIHCLRTLGITIEVFEDSIRVIGSIDDIKDGRYDLDANLSGTTIRFVLALLTIVPGIKTLKGKEGLNKRPIGELVEGLRQLGANIKYLDKEGCPPVRVLSSKLSSGSLKMSGEISSQFISAILMIAPLIGEVVTKVEGNQISKPYIDMTIDAMKKFGVNVINEGYKKYIVPNQQAYKVKQYIVEGDFSSAGYFLAIAALTKSTFTLKNLNPDSVQADRQILSVLQQMGNIIIRSVNEITIIGKGVKQVSVDMVDFPDQVQTVAVLASFTKGKTVIKGVKSLRIKETDRVKALQNELKKMNIRTESTDNTLIIYGGDPRSAVIDTYADHRMAMAFAVAGAKLSGMEIKNPEVVKKTFPNFWEALQSICVKVSSI